jgi:DNA polymerase III delta prime subunit
MTLTQFHGKDRPKTLLTREGLTDYLNTKPAEKPEDLTDAAYRAMSESVRHAYDRKRIVYLSGGVSFMTAPVKQSIVQLNEAFAKNAGDNSGNHGVMLSGPATTGKTMTLKMLMRHIYGQYRRQMPGFEPEDGVPVVFIQVPAGSTGKSLMRTFANFFGLPVGSSENMVSIRNRVCDLMEAAGTQLVVVDDLHLLAAHSNANGESVDALKNLHDQLAATFLYAGVNLAKGNLLSGDRGAQLRARYSFVEMDRFGYRSAAERANWKVIVGNFEKVLPLRHHRQGTLVELSDYCWERTSGSIGSLEELISGSARAIIGSSKVEREEIDLAFLETRTLDGEADAARARALKRVKTRITPESFIPEGLASA